MAMDIKGILDTLPHRYPFLLVDRITELEPGVRAVGIKNVTANEPQFTGHWPENPVMPGVLMLEAMAQVGGVFLLAEVEARARRRSSPAWMACASAGRSRRATNSSSPPS